MLFNSIEYLFFLPFVFSIYWLLSNKLKLQNLLLLIASYFFYGLWDYRFLSLIIISSFTDFVIGKSIYTAKLDSVKRKLLYLSLLINLGLLLVFKYYNFFIDSFISLFSSLKDRKYELALMRVMGSSPSKLFYLIILEGLILAVLGFLIGIFLSHVGMSVLSRYLEDAYRYAFSGWDFLREEWYLLAGALLIGFLAAIIPAIQASRTEISRTLSTG